MSVAKNVASSRVVPLLNFGKYGWKTARADLLAGLTVAVVAVPQAMAYALIAGVPPVYGIYTAIVQGLIAAFFTSSSHLSTGPINTLSLLVSSAVARLAGADPQRYIELVILMTFMIGMIQLFFAVARVSQLVRYVSHSVIVGFTAGAGVLIAVGQIPNFLGVDLKGVPRHLPGVLGQIERILPKLHDLNTPSLIVGGLALVMVIVIRMISKVLPGPLLAAIAGAAIVYFMKWTSHDLPIVGDLPKGLPAFKMPALSWKDAEEIYGGAIALSLVGMLEAYSIAKAIAGKTGQRISPGREFLAAGLSNTLSSFFQCIPGSGSFSRSALNFQAGAKTRMAGVYNSVFIAAIFLAFAPLAKYIPLASLAAILFVIAYGLIDRHYIRKIVRASRQDALVCGITFAATLFIPLEFAIFVGVILNLALYLNRASKLHLEEMVAQRGTFMERPLKDRSGEGQIIFLHVQGDLFFGLADELQDRLTAVLQNTSKIIIIRLKRTTSIDATVLEVLERFAKDVKKRQGALLLCGVRPNMMHTLEKFGVLGAIGPENVFVTGAGEFTSARQAIHRAKQILGSSIDTEDLDVDEPEAWAYEI